MNGISLVRGLPEKTQAVEPTCDTLGRPLRDLRISVTDRCNLRCTYCMPAANYPEDHCFRPREALLSFEEIIRVARLATELGVQKIRLTGGEPLLRHDLEQLVSMLAGLPGVKDIALTTNGLLLQRYARRLKDAGLDRITVSLDSLDPSVLRRVCGREIHPDWILDGIMAARDAGIREIKVNTVLQRGLNDGSVLELVRNFRDTGVVLRFIEFMDVGTMNNWNLEQVIPAREILERIHAHFPLEPIPARYPGEVASRYRFCDGRGEIGVIASVTRPFCGGCSRLRLTCDGHLFTCLFAGQGLDLRPFLRGNQSDDGIEEVIRGLWKNRTERYSEERASLQRGPRDKVEMYHIGG